MKRNCRFDRRRGGQSEPGESQPKSIWHPLSLQHMRPSQFVDVVNKILDGRNELCEGTLRGATGVGQEDRLIDQMKELVAATTRF